MKYLLLALEDCAALELERVRLAVEETAQACVGGGARVQCEVAHDKLGALDRLQQLNPHLDT